MIWWWICYIFYKFSTLKKLLAPLWFPIIVWSSYTLTISPTSSPILRTNFWKRKCIYLLIFLKPCLLCPFQKVRCVPRNWNKIKTVGHKKCQYQWLQKAVGRARAIFQCFGLLFLFSTILEAPSFSDKRMNMLDTFSIAFNKNIADSKAKLIWKISTTTTRTLQFQLYIFLYEL